MLFFKEELWELQADSLTQCLEILTSKEKNSDL